MIPDGSGRRERRRDDRPSPSTDDSPAEGAEPATDGEEGLGPQRADPSGTPDVGPVAGRPATTGEAARAHWDRRRRRDAAALDQRRDPPQSPASPQSPDPAADDDAR